MDVVQEYARGTTLEDDICAQLDLLPVAYQREIVRKLDERYRLQRPDPGDDY